MVSVGYGDDGRRLRRKVSGKTKAEVRQRLRAVQADPDIGVEAPASDSVREAVQDWLAGGLYGLSVRTAELYRDGVKPLPDLIGARPLRKLTAAMSVRRWPSWAAGCRPGHCRPVPELDRDNGWTLVRLDCAGMLGPHGGAATA